MKSLNLLTTFLHKKNNKKIVFSSPFMLLYFYFMEVSNTGIINSLFLSAVVSNVFHKPNIEKSLPNIKLVTKSTGAISLNTMNLSLFFFFLCSWKASFLFNYQIAATFVYNRTILEKLNFSIGNWKKKSSLNCKISKSKLPSLILLLL